MDPERQSAVAGAVLGAAVVVMGVAIVAIAFRASAASINMPRPLLALMGAGIVSCGAAFATATYRLRLALGFAIPGAALGFLLPIAWFALSPGSRECTASFVSAGGASLSTAWRLSDSTCRSILVLAALAAIVVVGGMVLAWRGLRDRR